MCITLLANSTWRNDLKTVIAITWRCYFSYCGINTAKPPIPRGQQGYAALQAANARALLGSRCSTLYGGGISPTIFPLYTLKHNECDDIEQWTHIEYSCRNKRTKLAIKKRRKRLGERVSLRYR